MLLAHLPVALLPTVLAALAGPAYSGRQAATADRLPVPTAPKQESVLQTLQDTYKSRLADSSHRGKLELATELLEKARGFKDPTDRFVYINEARRLSLEATDLGAALQAIIDLEHDFRVDPIELQVDAVTKVATDVKPDEADPVAKCALDLVEELMASGDLRSAEKVLKAGAPLNRKLSEPSMQLSRWTSTAWLVDQRQKVDQAREKLLSVPDDTRSLETLGRYSCLVENNFEQGLPMLKSVPRERSKDKELRRLAEDDILVPTEPDKQLELGKRWLDFSAKVGASMERKGPCQRAVYWLEKAHLAFAGTAKGDLVAARIEEARAMEIAPPAEAPRNAAPVAESKVRKLVEISASEEWQDVEFSFDAGEELRITARGEWCLESGNPKCKCRADGFVQDKSAMWVGLGVNAPVGALLGRIGPQVFRVGDSVRVVAQSNSRLQFRINEDDKKLSDNAGTLSVEITRTPKTGTTHAPRWREERVLPGDPPFSTSGTPLDTVTIGGSSKWRWTFAGGLGDSAMCVSHYGWVARAGGTVSFQVNGGTERVLLVADERAPPNKIVDIPAFSNSLERGEYGAIVKRVTGPHSRAVVDVIWDLTPYADRRVRLYVVDSSESKWAQIAVSEIVIREPAK